MTRRQWDKLKTGSIIKGRGKTSKLRRVLWKGDNNMITLRMISFASHQLWSGQYTDRKVGDVTHYCSGDKNFFNVVKF